jgi:hypothetical protein
LAGACCATVFGVAEIAVVVVAATLTDEVLAGASRLSAGNIADLPVLALSVGAAATAAGGHALSSLTGFANITVAIRGATALGHAVTVVADFASAAVAIAQAFIAAGGQALSVAATLTHGAVLIVSASTVAGTAASVGADFTSVTVGIGGAGSSLRYANVVIAGFSGRAVADVFTARRRFLASAIDAGFAIRAVAVLLAAGRTDAKAVFATLVWVAFGVHGAIRATASSATAAATAAAGRRTASEQQEGDESDAYIGLHKEPPVEDALACGLWARKDT